MNVELNIAGNKAEISFNLEAQPKEFAPVLATLEKEGKGISQILVDLRQVEYIRSEMLAELIAIKRLSDRLGASAKLLNAVPNVTHVLEISGLTTLFLFEQDYSRYSTEELLNLFTDPEHADPVSDFIASHYGESYHKIMKTALETEDPLLQEYALLTVGRAGDDELKEAAREKLSSAYSNVAGAAIRVLGWLGDTSSKERIYSFLKAEEETLLEAAGASIALLSDEEEPNRLKTYAESESTALRKVAAGALALINGNAAYKVLTAMLEKERDEGVRTVLARKIACFNREEATGALIKLLNDPSRKVQEAAAAGLERTGTRGHEEELLKKIGTGSDWVSYFAVRALGKQCSSNTSLRLQELYSSGDDKVRLAIVEAVGTAEDITPFLIERLKDDNEDIRKEALSALFNKDKTQGYDFAVKLASSDTSWLVRYKAVEIVASEKREGYKTVLSELQKNEASKYILEKIASALR